MTEADDHHPHPVAAMRSGVALAQDDDAMRCQAKTLRCDSEYFQCLSRCDRRDARAAGSRPSGGGEGGHRLRGAL